MNEALHQLVMDIMLDEDLKARALADSAAVLAERGITVPEGYTVRILEDTSTVKHLVLPYPAEEDSTDVLEQRTSKTGFT